MLEEVICPEDVAANAVPTLIKMGDSKINDPRKKRILRNIVDSFLLPVVCELGKSRRVQPIILSAL
jgi:hypothetical protein